MITGDYSRIEIEPDQPIEEGKFHDTLCPALGYFSLASLITFIGTISGFLATLYAIRGMFHMTVIMIHIAFLADILDGYAARKTGRCSNFGKELDSLNDFFNFAVMPTLTLYLYGYDSDIQVFVYIVFIFAGISRLAFFNISENVTKNGKNAFIGIPVPMATSIIYCAMITASYIGYEITPQILSVVLISLSILMLAPFRIAKYGYVTISMTLTVVTMDVVFLVDLIQRTI